jgi:hypothetical protein
MLQISIRIGPAAALSALMIVAASATSRAESPRVDVRIYDTGNSTPERRAAAIRTAAAIVAEAGIAVEWHDCTDNGRRPECRISRRAGNLIVRIMPASVAGSGTRGTALAAHSDSSDRDLRLGLAIIDPDTHAGEMATLFHEQVLTVAQRAGVESSELLGRALAHEIGHLLLGVTGHSTTGLMRAVWTDAELTQNRREDWLFAASDRKRLQRTP